MKTKGNVILPTVGKLLTELNEYEKKNWDAVLAVWMQDERTLSIVGMGLDAEGDLCISLEEMLEEEGFYCVADTIAGLNQYGTGVRVYLAGCGSYFSIDQDGGIFSKSDDEDIVGCFANVFGKYEIEQKPRALVVPRKNGREDKVLGYTLGVIMLGVLMWLVYNSYALIAGVSGPLWEKILWIVGCIVVLVVGCCTLFYSKK